MKFKITVKSLFYPERLANHFCRLFLVRKVLAEAEDRGKQRMIMRERGMRLLT